MSNLVIVESPAKAKTIKKYLGNNFEVVASMGHVRDLPKSSFGIDFENGYEPKYIAIQGKSKLITQLKSLAKKSDKVFLATDPDREGEAISWHLAHILGLDMNECNRITFNEITKTGVTAGMLAPRALDLNLVDAQQARRVLDRIVGYKISPFLWRKVKRGLSAGRVQSVVVRLIVDREREIAAHVCEEYWSIDAKLLAKSSRKAFNSKLHSKDGVKIEIQNKEQADKILADLDNADFVVKTLKKGMRKKSPAPPFITSTLQQEASKRLGFQSKRTMKAAQELYEGVDVDGLGTVGLITYMRTDSLRISNDAINEARSFISSAYGPAYLPSSPKYYKSKRNIQDAHEAIRPTMAGLTPEKVKANLTPDQYKLYKLIWERFIASQMANALLSTSSVDIEANDYIFKSSGYSVKFDGFTKLYEETKDAEDEDNYDLPELEEGEVLKVKELGGTQHFTQPPPRFTEASLTKALEENGIGRPSTYAPTITTVLSRDYIEREGKLLKPTSLGEVTTDLMCNEFPDIVNVEFTANMESSLDSIEEGKSQWQKVIDNFYKGFSKTLEKAEQDMDGTRVKLPVEESDVVCENCGRKMVIKTGKFGKFLACPGYPACKNTKAIVHPTEGKCPKCGGTVLSKKSKRGKTYFGCENNPKCDFMTWDTPTKESCPNCGGTLFKRYGKDSKTYCAKDGCGFEK